MANKDIELQPISEEKSQLDSKWRNMDVSYQKLFKTLLELVIVDAQQLSANNYEPFKNAFVDKLHWVKEPYFNQTLSIVQAIPGATTIQLVAAMGTLSKRSAWGGILAVFFYSFPSAVILMILGILLKQYKMNELNIFIYLGLYGMRASCVALIAHICIKLILGYVKNKTSIAQVLISAFFVFNYVHPSTLITLLALAAVFQIMVQYDNESKQDKDHKPETPQITPIITANNFTQEQENKLINPQNQHKFSNIMGSSCFHIYVLILLFLLYMRNQQDSIIWKLCLSFYKIGTLIIGGTPIMLPFMFAEIRAYENIISEDAFWIGFALSAAIPGPYINFAVFLGAHTLGIWGGIACWIVIFIPSLLQIWGLLPYWISLLKNQYLLKAREGVTSVSIGFLITAVYFSWVNATQMDPITATIISVLSLIYIVMLNLNCPMVIMIGAGLFIVRYLALWYYRNLEPEIKFFD